MNRVIALLLVSLSLLLTGCDHIQSPPVAPGGWQTLYTFTTKPHFLVSVGGQLYAGLASNEPADQGGFKRLVALNPVTGQLTEKAAFPGIALFGFSYFVLNGKLYVGLGAGSGSDPVYPFIERYNPYVYEYDPAANNWRQLEESSILTNLTPTAGPRLQEATSFTYKNKGILLFGVYRISSLNAFANNSSVAYAEGVGWGNNTVTIPSTPPIPYANDNLNRYFSVFRRGGLGFVLNDRIYTGGGRALSTGSVIVPDEIVARSLFGFSVAETTDGKGLALTLTDYNQTPSADIDLTNSSQSFVLNDKAYIIDANGGLIRFVPNTFQRITNVPEPLRFGTGLNGKAYFLSNTKLLVYQPD